MLLANILKRGCDRPAFASRGQQVPHEPPGRARGPWVDPGFPGCNTGSLRRRVHVPHNERSGLEIVGAFRRPAFFCRFTVVALAPNLFDRRSGLQLAHACHPQEPPGHWW